MLRHMNGDDIQQRKDKQRKSLM